MAIFKARETEIVICKIFACSSCGETIGGFNHEWNYCPFCGEQLEHLRINDEEAP